MSNFNAKPENLTNVKLDKDELDHHMKEAMEIKPDPKAIPNLDKLYEKAQKILQECKNELKTVEYEENKLNNDLKCLEKRKLENETEMEKLKDEKKEISEQIKNIDIEDDEFIELKNELKELFDKIEKDAEQIEKNIKGIKKEINELTKNTKEQTEKLKKQRSEIEGRIMRKYLMDVPKNIIDLMLEKDRDQNIIKLKSMFSMLKPVQSGKVNIETAQQHFNEGLNNEFVYPKFGGKSGFEKAMLNDNSTKK